MELLDPGQTDVLVTAALLGRGVDWKLLDAASGQPAQAVAQALEQGVGQGLLVSEAGEIRFRHALTRDALVASVLPPRRAELADRALAAVEAAHPELPGSWAGVVPAGPGVCVASYVPHAAVLPQAAAVVSHAGMGSLLEAFRAGVPSVCLPLGRDQADNAAAAAERGAAIALDPGATSGDIRAAITAALTSPALRRGARRMASEIAACGGAPAAAVEVEQVMRSGTSRAQLAGRGAGTGAAGV